MGERTKGLPLQLCTKGILYFISNDIPLQIRSKDVKVLLEFVCLSYYIRSPTNVYFVRKYFLKVES